MEIRQLMAMGMVPFQFNLKRLMSSPHLLRIRRRALRLEMAKSKVCQPQISSSSIIHSYRMVVVAIQRAARVEMIANV
jgi:hypothetical protein